jgi:hypothetical protein
VVRLSVIWSRLYARVQEPDRQLYLPRRDDIGDRLTRIRQRRRSHHETQREKNNETKIFSNLQIASTSAK